MRLEAHRSVPRASHLVEGVVRGTHSPFSDMAISALQSHQGLCGILVRFAIDGLPGRIEIAQTESTADARLYLSVPQMLGVIEANTARILFQRAKVAMRRKGEPFNVGLKRLTFDLVVLPRATSLIPPAPVAAVTSIAAIITIDCNVDRGWIPPAHNRVLQLAMAVDASGVIHARDRMIESQMFPMAGGTILILSWVEQAIAEMSVHGVTFPALILHRLE